MFINFNSVAFVIQGIYENFYTFVTIGISQIEEKIAQLILQSSVTLYRRLKEDAIGAPKVRPSSYCPVAISRYSYGGAVTLPITMSFCGTYSL